MESEKISKAELDKYIAEARAYAKKAVLPIKVVSKTVGTNLPEELFKEYSGGGTLKVQVTSGQGTLPVENALVEIASIFDGNRILIFSGKTNTSGIVDGVLLPALPTELSENFETAADSGIEYLVSITHAAFDSAVDVPIKIYNGIESILPVNLIPILR